jgi:hypothetical protein
VQLQVLIGHPFDTIKVRLKPIMTVFSKINRSLRPVLNDEQLQVPSFDVCAELNYQFNKFKFK